MVKTIGSIANMKKNMQTLAGTTAGKLNRKQKTMTA